MNSSHTPPQMHRCRVCQEELPRTSFYNILRTKPPICKTCSLTKSYYEKRGITRREKTGRKKYVKKPKEEWVPRTRATTCTTCGVALDPKRPHADGRYCPGCKAQRVRDKARARKRAKATGLTRGEWLAKVRKDKPSKPTSIALAIPKTKKHCNQCRCLTDRTGKTTRLCPNCKARNLTLRKRIKDQKKRARKKAIGGTVKVADLRYWADVQGGICYLCGEPMGEDVTADHVVPLAKGGTHQRSNIRLAHHLCNSVKSDGPVPFGALFV